MNVLTRFAQPPCPLLSVLLVVVLCESIGAWSGVATAQEPAERSEVNRASNVRKTAPPLQQTPVNFTSPIRGYVIRDLGRWTLYVERQLVEEDPQLAQRAEERLSTLLNQILDVIPVPSHARLGSLRLFLMHGVESRYGGRNNGLEYFAATAPEHYAHLDSRMASAILIYSATNWVWLPESRAKKALMHECAHAWHLEQWPELKPEIYDAWEHAMDLKLYQGVKDENGQLLERAYAVQNHLEYFAELSAIYFVGGYYHPFTREELRAYDPTGYNMIQQLWGTQQGP